MKVAALFALGSCISITDPDSPITKVVTLLKELKGRLESDEKAETKVYEKYECWCKDTKARKEKSIEKAKEDIKADELKVEELIAKSATLEARIEKATADVEESEKSLASLTSIRKKNRANYMTIKAEMEQSIDALAKAVLVLKGSGRHNVLLQSPEFVSLYNTINNVISMNNVSKKDLQLAQELVSKFTPSADDGSGTYSPQSATIVGILENMHDSFKADYKEATEKEKAEHENFLKMRTKIEDTLVLLREKIQKSALEKAETDSQKADTDLRLLDTKEQLGKDEKFLSETESACDAKSKSWAKRQELRAEELKGIAEALELLTAEENRKLFHEAIKPGMETFLQTESSRAPRNRAFHIISDVATHHQSLRLAALAASIKSGRFDAVIKQINNILEEMKEEAKKDLVDRDNCVSDRHRLNEENATNKHLKLLSENKVAKKERAIEKNNALLEEAAEAKAAAQKEIEELNTRRTEETEAFKKAKTDDETAVGLLEQVIAKLGAFHGQTGMMFTQEDPKGPTFERHEDDAPDATFSDKDVHKNESKGIVSLLGMIKGDLEREITNAVADEKEALEAHEAQVESLNGLIDSLDKKEITLKEANAARQAEISDEQSTIEIKEGEITATEEELDGMKKGCDWLTENFSNRAEKREAEKAALTSAKGLLAGAQVSLVSKHQFDDNVLPAIKFSSLSFLQKRN